MRIAVHHRPGSFSDQWLEYCQRHRVDHRLVDCHHTNILRELDGCSALMWHWAHWDREAVQFARQLTYSLEHAGLRVFPDARTCWHFDDKVGQKYLLEAIGAPLVPTYVFYSKARALEWAENAEYPKVFKQRGGASSRNVRLVHTRSQCERLIQQAFAKGFQASDPIAAVRDQLLVYRRTRRLGDLVIAGKILGRMVIPKDDARWRSRDRGYAYFQDFIPGCDHDIRVIVIGNRAFAIKRRTRENDFRASGSGLIVHDPKEIDLDYVKSAFDLAKRLGTQSVGLDFVKLDGIIKLFEASYAFTQEVYRDCPGYWDADLNWHDGRFFPEWFMIEDLLMGLAQGDQPEPCGGIASHSPSECPGLTDRPQSGVLSG